MADTPRAWHLDERILAGLGLATALALAVRAGPFHVTTLTAAAVTAVYVLTTRVLGRAATSFGWRVHLLAAAGFIAWFYLAVATITPALGTPLRDHELLALDEALFGGIPSVYWQQYAAPWLTELLSFCYVCYVPYGAVVLAHALWSPLGFGRHVPVYLAATFAVGFAGYLMLPARGPNRVFPELFADPLEGGPVTRFNAWMVQASSVYDAFPSLHVLIPCALLDHDWREARWRFWVALPLAAGMAIAAVYLRYHYASDLLAGFGLFLAVRAWFLCRTRRAELTGLERHAGG